MREGERGQGQGQRVERAFHSARLSAQNCMYGLFFFLPIADLGAISAQGSRSGGTQHRVGPRKDFGTIRGLARGSEGHCRRGHSLLRSREVATEGCKPPNVCAYFASAACKHLLLTDE